MLNKKIKSILVAGLVIMSMTGNAFANETESLPKEATITIENPDFGDFVEKIYDDELQDGKIVLTLNDDSSGYRAFVNWVAAEYKVTQIRLFFDDGSNSIMDIKLPGETKEGENCHDATLVGDRYKVGTNVTTDKKLIRVEIDYINLTKDDEAVDPDNGDDEKEKEKITDPATGDASIMPLVATAVVSAAGLFVLNRKDEE